MLRKKELLAKLSKFTKWQLFSLKMVLSCLSCKNQFQNWFLQAKNPVRRTWFFQLDFSKFKYRSTGGEAALNQNDTLIAFRKLNYNCFDNMLLCKSNCCDTKIRCNSNQFEKKKMKWRRCFCSEWPQKYFCVVKKGIRQFLLVQRQ